ncbi:MAG: hypothetical protein WC455_11135 [Dehalococcoidia bacterium]|jgi:hypothetical protein
MVKKVTKSALAAKLGTKLKEAYEGHKDDEVVFDAGGSLPGGIENGIAQLVDCYFKPYEKGTNKGQFFFYAAGIVKKPTEHDGVPIAGLRTSIMEPMCDTPSRSRQTISDHMGWILNEWKKLVPDLDLDDVGYDELEATAATIKELAPHFRFRTWKGAKQEIEERDGAFYVGDKKYKTEAAAKAANPYVGTEPRTNEVWNGAVDYVEDDDEEVEDVVDAEEEEEAAEEEASDEEVSLEDLATAADEEGDEDAATEISNRAEACGLDPESYDTWADCAAAIEGAGKSKTKGKKAPPVEEEEGEEAEAEEEEAEWEPAVGDVYKYKPPKAKKAIEVEVKKVFKPKRTCNLESLDDQKAFKLVSWDELVGDE